MTAATMVTSTTAYDGAAVTDLHFTGAERARRCFVLLLCLLVAGLSAFADTLNNYWGVAFLTAALFVGFPRAGRSSLASVITVTGVAFGTMPYIGLYYVNIDVQTAWFALLIVVGLALTSFAEPTSTEVTPAPAYNRADLPLVAVFLVGGLSLWNSEGILQISFYAGWAIALLHMERVHVATTSWIYRGWTVLFFAAVIGFFVAFLWEGFGRIVQLSFALAPILLTVHYRTIRLNAAVLAGGAVGLSFIGRVLRFGWGDGLAGLSADSGASPITLTSYLWTTSAIGKMSDTILDQWLLFFLNWVPREFWANKPLGVGSSFVDAVMGRQGASADHNVALGFFGEHMFYLPHAWFMSAGLLVLVVIAVRRGLWCLCAPYYSPLIVLDVWFMTLFWGGMAAFAARAWFALIPLVPYVLFIKWLDRRGKHRVPNSARRVANV